jgi:hypothetical protein
MRPWKGSWSGPLRGMTDDRSIGYADAWRAGAAPSGIHSVIRGSRVLHRDPDASPW